MGKSITEQLITHNYEATATGNITNENTQFKICLKIAGFQASKNSK